MQFVRKQFLLILCILFVYGAYVVTHVHTSSPQHVLGVSSNLSLFIEPDFGKSPLIDAINTSQKEVDVEVYLLSDKDIIASLLTACERGVVVRLMLEEHPFGGGNINQKTFQTLSSTCVHVAWTNPTFALTHEKTIVIDNQKVLITSQNLTTASFTTNREYDIVDENPQDVSEISTIFTMDWERKSPTLADSNLVVSPINSREKLSGLLSSATKHIVIEMEVIDDPDIVQILQEKAAKIPVEIIMPSLSQVASNKKVAQKLRSVGVAIKTMTHPYIHAKLIIIDNVKAYVGSVNFTTQSMDANREVGIIISQPDILSTMQQTFDKDWENATSL